MEKEVKKIKMGEEFSVCPTCGFSKGFHNMFKKKVENGHLEWYLICPKCESVYDIGLTYLKP